jgi:hypothetical protein
LINDLESTKEFPLNRVYIACINRGILDDAQIVSIDKKKIHSQKILESITRAASLMPDSPECWPLSGFSNFGIWPMDVESLVANPASIANSPLDQILDIALDDLKALLKDVDCVTINDEEARMLSGDYSLRRAAKTIMAMGPKTLIIKKGEHGALLFQGEEIFYCPALPLEEVFDPTGAGDTFAGGFISHLAKTEDLSFENMKRGLVYGSAMASFCVEKFGSERIQNLTQEEIAARVEEFRKLATFVL